MANGTYLNFRDLRNGGGVHDFVTFATEDLNAYLLDASDYTRNLSTHIDVADISAAVVATTVAVSGGTGVVIDDGINFPDFVFTTPSGDDCDELVFAADQGADSVSPLIINFDTATGLPIALNSQDVTVVLGAKLFVG